MGLSWANEHTTSFRFFGLITLLLSLWKLQCSFKQSFETLVLRKKTSEFQVIFLEVSSPETNKHLVGGVVADFHVKYEDIMSLCEDQMLATRWIQLSLFNCKTSSYIDVSNYSIPIEFNFNQSRYETRAQEWVVRLIAEESLQNFFYNNHEFDNLQKFSSALQEAKVTIESLKQNCEQLKEEKGILEKSVRDFSMENESLLTEVDSLKSRIAVLEMQSKLAKASKAEEEDRAIEIANLKELIQELEDKNKTLTEEIDKLDKDNKLLEFNLQDSAQALKHMYKERDLLKNRITGLLNEIAALKSHTPDKHTFVDFVHLKRDYNSLKEEHEKLLKRRSSKTKVLPTLKATDTTLVTRASSGGTVRSTAAAAAAGRVGSFS